MFVLGSLRVKRIKGKMFRIVGSNVGVCWLFRRLVFFLRSTCEFRVEDLDNRVVCNRWWGLLEVKTKELIRIYKSQVRDFFIFDFTLKNRLMLIYKIRICFYMKIIETTSITSCIFMKVLYKKSVCFLSCLV